jgi:hypothetical protein
MQQVLQVGEGSVALAIMEDQSHGFVGEAFDVGEAEVDLRLVISDW